MHENAQKWTETSEQNCLRLHVASPWKFAHLHDAFSEFFKLEASPVEGQSLQQKDKKRRNRKSAKKLKKNLGHFLVQKSRNFDFCSCPSENAVKRGASEKNGVLPLANAFLSRLELIWPISRLKISKMSKNTFLAKRSGSQWVKKIRKEKSCVGYVKAVISHVWVEHYIAHHSVRQSVSQSVSQSVNRPISKLISQSISQPVNQSDSQ